MSADSVGLDTAGDGEYCVDRSQISSGHAVEAPRSTVATLSSGGPPLLPLDFDVHSHWCKCWSVCGGDQ